MMGGKIVLFGGRLIDSECGIDETGDLGIENGRITHIGGSPLKSSGFAPEGDWNEAEFEGARVINCAGKIVSPGFIDLHVHLREPGGEAKETIETGTAAAVRGGYTTVCAMPNTAPPIADKTVVSYVQERADEVGHCRVMPIGAITRARAGEGLAPYEGMIARGVTLFSDDGDDIDNAGLLLRAMEELSSWPATVCIHAEIKSLTFGGVIHEGVVAAKLGYLGIPPVSETVAIARAIIIAEHIGAPVHICHLSCAGSIELVRYAKAKGLPVTAEVTPHHLLLTDEAVERSGAVAKVNPPLRSEFDRKLLVAALSDKTIDCIATDHAPHTRDEKETGVENAPFGIVGLETATGLLWKHLVMENQLSIERFLDALTARPAHILTASQAPRDDKLKPALTERGRRFHEMIEQGFCTLTKGAVADITVFDPDCEWKVEQSEFVSKAKFSPFEGWDAQGRAHATIVGGNVRYMAGIFKQQ